MYDFCALFVLCVKVEFCWTSHLSFPKSLWDQESKHTPWCLKARFDSWFSRMHQQKQTVFACWTNTTGKNNKMGLFPSVDNGWWTESILQSNSTILPNMTQLYGKFWIFCRLVDRFMDDVNFWSISLLLDSVFCYCFIAWCWHQRSPFKGCRIFFSLDVHLICEFSLRNIKNASNPLHNFSISEIVDCFSLNLVYF